MYIRQWITRFNEQFLHTESEKSCVDWTDSGHGPETIRDGLARWTSTEVIQVMVGRGLLATGGVVETACVRYSFA
jgi:hypothetical protein